MKKFRGEREPVGGNATNVAVGLDRLRSQGLRGLVSRRRRVGEPAIPVVTTGEGTQTINPDRVARYRDILSRDKGNRDKPGLGLLFARAADGDVDALEALKPSRE
jgi:hypothetical protein